MVGPSSDSAAPSRTRLLIIYGGRSAEHEVSCISAHHVVEAVDPDRYELRLVGITTDGRWVDTTTAALRSREKGLPSPDEVADAPGPPGAAGAAPSPGAAGSARTAGSVGTAGSAGSVGQQLGLAVVGEELRSAPGSPGSVVVLPLVHGPMGEDGTVQGLLELIGLPYCGPGVAGSAAAMDKGMAKALLTAAGLPQARYIHRYETQIEEHLASEVEDSLGWPVFVKPANMGSSIGISKVTGPDHLSAALDLALRYDDQLVIEEAVNARELEIGVLGWPDLRTSVPGEIKPSRDFYDFDDKYLAGYAGLEIPARLPEGVAEEMARLAVAACRALRVDSMARVDFFLEEHGRGLLINEINTIPGFTPISMFPRMWAASGVSYTELLEELVDQAQRRAARRARFETGH